MQRLGLAPAAEYNLTAALAESRTSPDVRVPARQGYAFGVPPEGLDEWTATTTAGDGGRRSQLTELYEAYRKCPWAWAGVNAIARRVTAGGLEFVYDPAQDESGDDEQPPKPPEVLAAERLFAYTNERQNILQLLRAAAAGLVIGADSFIEIVWIGKIPVALHMLPARDMTPLMDQHGQLTGYVQLTEYGQEARFEPHQVVWISLDSPEGGVFGAAPLAAALVAIERWLFTAATQLHTYRKGDPLQLHIDLPADMTGPDIRRWIAQFLARNIGPANIGYPVVTKNGGKVNELGVRRIEAQNATLDKARDEILGALGVPPAKAGVIESGNLGGGTDEGQDKTFALQTCDPIAQVILDQIQFHIAERGFGVADWKLRFAEVDTRDSKTIEEIREKRFKNGAYTLNEWRADIGLPGVEGGDQAMVLVAQGSVMRIRDIEASALASIAKQIQGTGWEIEQTGNDDEPIMLVQSETPAEQRPQLPPVPPPSGTPPSPPAGGATGDEDPQLDDPADGATESAHPSKEGKTGGMVALLPDAATAARLAAAGGLPVEELHLTLAFLGDVTEMPVDVLEEIPYAVRTALAEAGVAGPVTARAFAHTTFNADGGPDGDRDPCAVYGIGDSPQLTPLHAAVVDALGDVDGLPLPAQHQPFAAHVTAGYGMTAADLAYLGPVTFDRVVVALADDWTELPLTTVEHAEVDGVEEAGTSPKAREWPGWQHDEATADHYAQAIVDDVTTEMGDVADLAAAWLASDESRTTEEVAPLVAAVVAAAAAWLAARAVRFAARLVPRVQDAMAEGYLIGERSARAVLTVSDPVWDEWTPGDPDAARKILGDDGSGSGLQDLLDDSDVRLTGIADDRMAAFARLLARAVAEGWSVDQLAEKLLAFRDDRNWAYVTAQTELARAISAATVDQYEDHDIDQHEWLVAGEDPEDRVRVCPICMANAAAGPVDVGAAFPSGDKHPPAHPRCRCAVMPVIDLDGLDDPVDTPAAVPDEPAGPMSPDDLVEHYQDAIGDVTDDERDALSRYTGGEFAGMNSYLRYGPTSVTDWAGPSVDALARLALRYVLPSPVTVWRRVSVGAVPAGVGVGQVITDPAFSSTSLVEDPPPGFRSAPTVLQITVPQGMPGIVVNGIGNGVEDENELILPPGTRFVVDADETRGDVRWLTMTALPPSP
jgi:SPP1 gp7 family putative phage head morphogenesis protein